jgi:outer membrane protein TolC
MLFVWILGVFVILLAGCTAKHYQKTSNRDAYKLIRQGQQQALGKTNVFDINTRYSARDPQAISPKELIDDRDQGSDRVLSIEQALDLAAKNSRRYQSEKEKLFQLALNVTGARHDFRPSLIGTSTGKAYANANNDKLGSVNSQMGAKQTLMTGGRIGVSIANDLLYYGAGTPRRTAISTISADLFQPLLRDLGRYNSTIEALTQAERNLIYGIRSFSQFQNAFAVEIVNDYFKLLAQKEVVRSRYTNYLSRVKSTRRLEARANDRERAMDVDQARQAELGAVDNYVKAVASYFNQMNQFKVKLALPIAEQIQLDDQLLKDLHSRGPLSLSLPRDEAYRMAVSKQFEVLNAIDKFEDSKRKIKVTVNRLKADLNIVGEASLESDRPIDYTKFNPGEVQGSIGLELKLPFDRLKERNDYRASLITFESELRTLTLRLDTLKDGIDGGLRSLEQRRQSYQIQTSALKLADRLVENISLLLEAGRAEIRDLLEAQDSQIAAQIAVNSELLGYQESVLQLLLDIGVIETGSDRFWLKDQVSPHFEAGTQPPPVGAARLPSGELISPDKLFK